MGLSFKVSVEQLVKLGEAATKLGISLDDVSREFERFASAATIAAAAQAPPPPRRAMALDGPVPA